MSNSLKPILLSLFLLLSVFGGREAAAWPIPAALEDDSHAQHSGSLAQGDVVSWPGTLPELVRLSMAQAPPATPAKQQNNLGYGTLAPELEHWLQQGISRQVAFSQRNQVSLSSTRIIFPFHYFW